METSTELTWMLLLFAATIGFLNQAPLGDSPLVWGAAMWILIPFQLAMDLSSALPLIAPLAILALVFYKINILQANVGEGMMMFILAAAIMVLTGV